MRNFVLFYVMLSVFLLESANLESKELVAKAQNNKFLIDCND